MLSEQEAARMMRHFKVAMIGSPVMVGSAVVANGYGQIWWAAFWAALAAFCALLALSGLIALLGAMVAELVGKD